MTGRWGPLRWVVLGEQRRLSARWETLYGYNFVRQYVAPRSPARHVLEERAFLMPFITQTIWKKRITSTRQQKHLNHPTCKTRSQNRAWEGANGVVKCPQQVARQLRGGSSSLQSPVPHGRGSAYRPRGQRPARNRSLPLAKATAAVHMSVQRGGTQEPHHFDSTRT